MDSPFKSKNLLLIEHDSYTYIILNNTYDYKWFIVSEIFHLT